MLDPRKKAQTLEASGVFRILVEVLGDSQLALVPVPLLDKLVDEVRSSHLACELVSSDILPAALFGVSFDSKSDVLDWGVLCDVHGCILDVVGWSFYRFTVDQDFSYARGEYSILLF